MAMPAIVVADDPSQLVLYVPHGSPFGFAQGTWPTVNGRHPWEGLRSSWSGYGSLMLHPAGEPFSIWHFWCGPNRSFKGWYLNLQAPYQRTPIGIDTLDHEIDIVIEPDGAFQLKDQEALNDCVQFGRFDLTTADGIRRTATELTDRLAEHGIWWDPQWADWQPPAGWSAPTLPATWH